ncbi:MAG: hypothetical protein EA383_14205 [Spirochaetaceae bacterium]|nr:MAG: hypothetical protein EA383_14205 [Spirochaetaceae bacterium]
MKRCTALFLVALFVSATTVLSAQVESGDGNALAANLWFGTSRAGFSGFDTEPLQITQLRDDYNNTTGDSIDLTGIDASVNPEDSLRTLVYQVGIGLGWFPGFTAFRFGNDDRASVGIMGNLGANFGDGLGPVMGIGPEINYQRDRFAVHIGLDLGFSLMFKTLGEFVLDGTDAIVVQDRPDGSCTDEDFESGSFSCRRHTSNSTVQVTGFATTRSPYLNLMYVTDEEANSGVGLTIGYRLANNQITYTLRGSNDTENTLNGQEFEEIENAFDLSGFYVRINFIQRPL